MLKEEIFVAFTDAASVALGNMWRITAKKTDFYLDPLGDNRAFRLSVHGPNEQNPDGHRFHFKVDRDAVKTIRAKGDFVLHHLPRAGQPIDGCQLAPGVFHVACVRWVWDLQRERYRRMAASGQSPEIGANQSGAKLALPLPPNAAADLDLIVSYNEPYWPEPDRSLREGARLGPLSNAAGMWFTGTTYQRSQLKYPTPDAVSVPRPTPSETPNRILSAGPAPLRSGDIYWFVESITSRELLLATMGDSERL